MEQEQLDKLSNAITFLQKGKCKNPYMDQQGAEEILMEFNNHVRLYCLDSEMQERILFRQCFEGLISLSRQVVGLDAIAYQRKQKLMHIKQYVNEVYGEPEISARKLLRKEK